MHNGVCVSACHATYIRKNPSAAMAVGGFLYHVGSVASYLASGLLMTALCTAFQLAAVIPQLQVLFLFTWTRIWRLFTFLLAFIPMVLYYYYFLFYCLGRYRIGR